MKISKRRLRLLIREAILKESEDKIEKLKDEFNQIMKLLTDKNLDEGVAEDYFMRAGDIQKEISRLVKQANTKPRETKVMDRVPIDRKKEFEDIFDKPQEIVPYDDPSKSQVEIDPDSVASGGGGGFAGRDYYKDKRDEFKKGKMSRRGFLKGLAASTAAAKMGYDLADTVIKSTKPKNTVATAHGDYFSAVDDMTVNIAKIIDDQFPYITDPETFIPGGDLDFEIRNYLNNNYHIPKTIAKEFDEEEGEFEFYEDFVDQMVRHLLYKLDPELLPDHATEDGTKHFLVKDYPDMFVDVNVPIDTEKHKTLAAAYFAYMLNEILEPMVRRFAKRNLRRDSDLNLTDRYTEFDESITNTQPQKIKDRYVEPKSVEDNIPIERNDLMEPDSRTARKRPSLFDFFKGD